MDIPNALETFEQPSQRERQEMRQVSNAYYVAGKPAESFTSMAEQFKALKEKTEIDKKNVTDNKH